jgi:hypothetical protein
VEVDGHRVTQITGSIAPVIAIVTAATLEGTLQMVLVLIGLAAALAVGRSKRKDQIIGDLEKSEARLEKALEGASKRADEEHERRRQCEKSIERWQARYEEQSKYTAKEAFEAVVGELGELRATLKTSIDTQGELILKNIEQASGAVSALERVASDIEAMTERMHPETLAQVAGDLARLADRLGAGGDRPADTH